MKNANLRYPNIDKETNRGSWKPAEFMARHGISHATFWRWVRDGTIRVVRIGRVTRVPASEEARLMAGEPPV